MLQHSTIDLSIHSGEGNECIVGVGQGIAKLARGRWGGIASEASLDGNHHKEHNPKTQANLGSKVF